MCGVSEMIEQKRAMGKPDTHENGGAAQERKDASGNNKGATPQPEQKGDTANKRASDTAAQAPTVEAEKELPSTEEAGISAVVKGKIQLLDKLLTPCTSN